MVINIIKADFISELYILAILRRIKILFKGERKLKSKILKSGVIFLVGALIVLLIGTSFSQISVMGINKNINIKTVELKENGNNITFDLKYPEVQFENEHVKNKINIALKEQIYEFKKYIEDIYNETMSTTPKEIVENSASFDFKGMSTFEYEVVDNILSIRLNLIQFTGGAHPMTYVRDFNFDLNTGNVVKFKDLFNEEGKKTYKQIVDKIIVDTMNSNPDNYFTTEFKGIGDNVQYYLTKDNVVIFYQLYELAPYAAGIPEFKIPYETFKGLINVDPSK